MEDAQLTEQISQNLNKKIIGQEELKNKLFNLKKYYNELNVIRIKNHNYKVELEKKNSSLTEKLQEIENLQDINILSSDHIISVKEQGSQVETREDIQKRIEELIEKKNNLLNLYTNEKEYSRTLHHMIESEKTKIEKINKQIIECSEKRESIKYAKRNLDQNEIEHQNKTRNFNIVKSSLDHEMNKLNNVIHFQNTNLRKIDKELELELLFIKNRRIRIEKLDADKKSEVENEKRRILSNIDEAWNKKNEIICKEKNYIKMILGIYILNKYFIKNRLDQKPDFLNSFKEKELLESNEYKQFISEKFTLVKYNDEIKDNEVISNNTSFRSSFLQREKSIKKEESKKISVESITAIFNETDLEYDDLYNFYTKLISQINHYHNSMMYFNLKLINLESQKDKYNQKVKIILSKNYQNFYDLVNSNSKLQNFLERYRKFSDKNTKSSFFAEDGINLNSWYPEYNEFYSRCYYIVTEFKNFFEYFLLNFKSISLEINENHILSQNHNCEEIKIDVKEILEKIKLFDNIDDQAYMYLLKESLEKIASQQTEEEMLNETFNLNNFLSEPTIKELLTFHVPLHKNILKFLCSYNQILKVFTRCRQIMEALISMRQDSNEIAYSSLIDDQIYPKKEDIDEGYDMYIKENEYVENIEDKLSKNKIKKLENNKNKNFIEKFYKPFMNKRIYKTKLNENISSVKKMTRNSAMENFILEKKKRQIDKISQEILIYNNPKINLNNLSNNTYNQFVKYVIKNQLEQNKSH